MPGWSRDPATSDLLHRHGRGGRLPASSGCCGATPSWPLAREELADIAVEQERARFARDLHDLLGHCLTVITVKAELAGQLMARDPGRAAAEVADIERLAREALADVRATVAGYREVTLAAEISSARSALDAAGIEAELPGAVDDVPGERRELFGWVVREGVTNVRAALSRPPGAGRGVADNGRGRRRRPGLPGDRGGRRHGLDGLRERLAAVGGRLDGGAGRRGRLPPVRRGAGVSDPVAREP